MLSIRTNSFRRSSPHVSLYLVLLLCALCLYLLPQPADGRRAGGGGRSSSGRSSSGRSGGSWGGSRSSSSSRSSWGSSSRSGSSRSSWSWGSSSRTPSSSTRWGSSSPSGSSRWSSPSPSPSPSSGSSWFSWGRRSGSSSSSPSRASPSSTKWGSSAPSGRFSAPKPAINYAPAGSAAIRSSINRPVVNIPISTGSVRPVVPVYSTYRTYVPSYHYIPGSYSNTYLLSHNNGYVNGYLLGRMVAGSHYRDSYGCCYGCGCSYYGPYPAYYYDDYVPYRYSYIPQTTSGTVYTTPSPAVGSEKVDVCALARWNLELPFSELPNMLLKFMASDNVSGSSLIEKSRFIKEVLNTSAETYGNLPERANIFQIDRSYDLKQCNIQIKRHNKTLAVSQLATPSNGTNSTAAARHVARIQNWRTKTLYKGSPICRNPEVAQFIDDCQLPPPDEPFFAGVNQIIAVYLNNTTNNTALNYTTASDALQVLVTAAKNCYPNATTPDLHLAPCLDFSLDAQQVRAMTKQGSIFASEEICRKYLTPDVNKCTTPPPSAIPKCSKKDLVALNVFARNFYLCQEPVDSTLITTLQSST